MSFALPPSRLRRMRQTLRDERNLLDVLLNSVDVAVVACSANGQLTHVNRRSVELMGLDGSAARIRARGSNRCGRGLRRACA